MRHLICDAREEHIDEVCRTAYRLNDAGGLDAFMPYPDSRVEPALFLDSPGPGAPADGRYKWSTNCAHLLYDVLSDFLFQRELDQGTQVVMKRNGLADQLVRMLGGSIIDVDSEAGKALTDDQLARVENRWRFVGAKHSAITKLWRRELLANSPEPTQRRNYIIARRVRYKEWTYNRNIAHLEQVIESLGREGLHFEVVYLEDLPLARQIEVFKSADMIISTHGSGLVWLQLCRPGTVCIEVLTPYFTKTVNPKADFWHIARHSGIRYVPFYCDSMLGDVASAYDNDAVVPPDLLLRLLDIGRGRAVPELAFG